MAELDAPFSSAEEDKIVDAVIAWRDAQLVVRACVEADDQLHLEAHLQAVDAAYEHVNALQWRLAQVRAETRARLQPLLEALQQDQRWIEARLRDWQQRLHDEQQSVRRTRQNTANLRRFYS